MGQIAELNRGPRRARGKRPLAAGRVPANPRLVGKPGVRPRNESAGQRQTLRILAEDERRIAGNVHVLERRHQESHALAAAGRTAEQGLAPAEIEKRRLLRRRHQWTIASQRSSREFFAGW